MALAFRDRVHSCALRLLYPSLYRGSADLSAGAAPPSTGKPCVLSRNLFPGLLRTTLVAALLVIGIQGGAYSVIIWLPTFLKTVRHLSVLNTSGYLMVFIVSSFIGYVSGAYTADKIGRRFNFIFFALAEGATAVVYTYVPITNSLMLFLGIPLGFFYAGCYSAIGALLNELFPTRIRGSGVGFCFNFGRAIASVFPLLVGALSASLTLGPAIALFTTGAYGLVVIAALLLPETRGQALS